MNQSTCPILHHTLVAPATYQLGFYCPEIAQQILPGQFLMIRPSGTTAPLLGRAFALYDLILDSQQQPFGIEVVYHVFGPGTQALSLLQPGQEVEVWGPLGNSFLQNPNADLIQLVAGGIGQTPFYSYAKYLLGQQSFGKWPILAKPKQVHFRYGVRTKAMLACLEDFQNLPILTTVFTEDGSLGVSGRVTDGLTLPASSISIACGPEPMLRAIWHQFQSDHRSLYLSLETPMACGFGACFSCVVPIRQTDGSVDFRRSCVDGPIFAAKDLAWETPKLPL